MSSECWEWCACFAYLLEAGQKKGGDSFSSVGILSFNLFSVAHLRPLCPSSNTSLPAAGDCLQTLKFNSL
jgi:hypothetical protein